MVKFGLRSSELLCSVFKPNCPHRHFQNRMALKIQVARPTGRGAVSQESSHAQETYWKAQNHSENSYLRAENWKPDVKEFCFPTSSVIVPLPRAAAQAMLRYREEIKMYAALRDEAAGRAQTNEEMLVSMDDPAFLDAQHERVVREWPTESATKRSWWAALETLRASLDAAVAPMSRGAFLKLSVRSPKDAAFYLSSTYKYVHQRVEESRCAFDSPEMLSENVSIIKSATWNALRVATGAEALQVLLRSDRIYVDILQHDLFHGANFNLNLHVMEFFDQFDPDFEFRYFVVNGKRTALSVYNPWVYHPEMVEKKDIILSLIESTMDRAQPKIASCTYSVDFAVSLSLNKCWLVEVNEFVPPLAGSGLFSMRCADDRDILQNGPFEFRVRSDPITASEFFSASVNDATHEASTVHMQPAPPLMMDFIEDARRRKAGLPVVRRNTNPLPPTWGPTLTPTPALPGQGTAPGVAGPGTAPGDVAPVENGVCCLQ